MYKPNTIGITRLSGISLTEIAPFINWKFFFHAWRITGKYEGIESVCDCTSCKTAWLLQFPENEREKAEEALKLFRDAQEVLRQFSEEKGIRINATFGLFGAYSENDDIVIVHEGEKTRIPTLRQQHTSTDGFCYALADFLNSKDDYIGIFANTVSGAEEIAKKYEEKNDLYHSILVKTVADRLAEATSEWLHFQVRKKYWGYNPEEQADINNILRNDYPGIRPAVGYPSLPDQSIIFELEKLLYLKSIGISLTENGAMYPNASVCGLYFSHPQSKYFMIGKIDNEQLEDYAQRREKTTAEMRKWLSSNLQ
ncbi:hypothetical protein D0T49_05120 [Paludibacter sp. 221]|uniref:vitamin B12 dependent-methionine synthase activation domain-containing protein n=1 Tax=Paludibacter sp. 221 TaxID=2302939 RepID=UPI0013D2EF5B|nr:hypothetical protein [Paludibacter sp. 221]